MNSKSMKWAFTGVATAATFFATGVAASAESYTVKSGDTLSAIAKEKNTTVDKIVELNKLSNADLIEVGQVLELDENTEAASASEEQAVVAGQETATQQVPATAQTYSAPASTNYSSGAALSNGNTAGETGSYAAARMAELTGVSASTWEYIIARESNGQVNAYNASGASGLFQTMPGWGSTTTVDEQVQAAYRAYSAQGLSAWGY